VTRLTHDPVSRRVRVSEARPLSQADRQALADAVPFWWHSIELGEGAVSRGRKTPEIHARELEAMRLPDLRGKTVLDIGAWDGFYSFRAEELGATRVVALDHYMWGLDFERGDSNLALDLERLPGRRGFDLAHSLRESRVEPVVADFMTMDLDALGRFDIVLFLGVLYHLQDPLGALSRLRHVTGELAIIETHGVRVADYEHHALWQFYPHAELIGDPTNWWGPNARALVGACTAAGFPDVEIVSMSERDLTDDIARLRMIAHARPTVRRHPVTAPVAETREPGPRAQLQEVRVALRDARTELAAAWRELDMVYSSRSWRLTAQLRAIGAALRRLRRASRT
jgi:tRNA (mo5U34)-methyltransferase